MDTKRAKSLKLESQTGFGFVRVQPLVKEHATSGTPDTFNTLLLPCIRLPGVCLRQDKCWSCYADFAVLGTCEYAAGTDKGGNPCRPSSASTLLSAHTGRNMVPAPLQVSRGAAVVVHSHEVHLAFSAVHRGAVAEKVVKPAPAASLGMLFYACRRLMVNADRAVRSLPSSCHHNECSVVWHLAHTHGKADVHAKWPMQYSVSSAQGRRAPASVTCTKLEQWAD